MATVTLRKAPGDHSENAKTLDDIPSITTRVTYEKMWYW
jgi:hypothetical protein